MTRQEILITLYGEMRDMIACLLIDEGRAEYKAPPRKWDIFEALALK